MGLIARHLGIRAASVEDPTQPLIPHSMLESLVFDRFAPIVCSKVPSQYGPEKRGVFAMDLGEKRVLIVGEPFSVQ